MYYENMYIYRLKSQSLIKHHHKCFSRSCQKVFAVVTYMVVAEGSISRNTVTVLVNVLLLASKVKPIKRYVFQNETVSRLLTLQ